MKNFGKDLELLKQQMNNEENLKNNAESAGLELEQTPSDGNCMFHALASQLHRTGLPISHSDLRAHTIICG